MTNQEQYEMLVVKVFKVGGKTKAKAEKKASIKKRQAQSRKYPPGLTSPQLGLRVMIAL